MFGWSDLSRDVIMDVGCGEEGYCGKAILEKFPDVGAIIGIDSHPKIVRNFRLRTAAKAAEVNDSLARNEILTDDEIIRTVTTEDDDDDVIPVNSKISHSEAGAALSTSVRWAEEQNFEAHEIMLLRRLRDRAFE
ncbi:hypothetical protein AVEN_33256-1 [Araneus ventricosus]|uniref:Methyltransferase domain-containing protein n=1 Tax=Araneus ventricosus TaxID=182803 RepID=A0A4Y2VT09_ARAVE|nr:hypothetical protein AVEN_33256-1 [Araneus ventricosus]